MLKNKTYSRYYIRTLVEIMVLATFLMLSIGMVGAQIGTSGTLQETQPQDTLQMSGRLQTSGTHFELKDSRYLDITLDSSEPISLTIESPPNMVTMQFESVSDATTAKIIMRGFAPQTTYRKYQDDYHNLVTFTTDDSGSYTYTQDISEPHFVFIQTEPDKVSKSGAIVAIAANPLPGTIFIRDDATGGDCILIGTWDNSTKTCTLTTDISETIQIDNDGITLNGNGHISAGSGTGSGVYFSGRSNVTIKNIAVKNFTDGFYYTNGPVSGSKNTLIDNIANSNYRNGIYFISGGENNLTNNTVNLNLDSGIVLDHTGKSTLLYNNVSYNNKMGIYLYQSSDITLIGNNISNNVGDGIISYQGGSHTLRNNIINSNEYGVYFRSGINHIFINNIVNLNRGNGIDIFHGYNNGGHTLINNTANFNSGNGISIGDMVSYSTVTGNNASYNNNSGIFLGQNYNNTFTGNNASYNNNSGIYVFRSGFNTIINNIFSENSQGISMSESGGNNYIYNNYFNNTQNSEFDIQSSGYTNSWNTTRTPGTNIIGGPYLGGNSWAHPNGTGFSQTCPDNNKDGLCDVQYTLNENNIDYLPLATEVEISNLIRNPGFESGTSQWIFYTSGTGKFISASPGFEGSKSANIVLYTGGTNIQLYQKEISLEPKTRYRLSFAAYSTRGHDLKMLLIKHASPFTRYGLDQAFNLSNSWQGFSTEFTTTGFSGTVSDGRLMFYLAPFARAGDKYYIDNVRLEKI